MSDPTNNEPQRPAARRADALAVVKRLREAKQIAYFAGGCVRDELMGIKPKDYDIATDASPQRVKELFNHAQAVGAAFGVMLVRQNQSVMEVATFRRDGEYLDGRRPSNVQFTTPQEDAQRRDFTINGLFFDPVANEVVDFVGGREDLKAKLLRAIGNPDARFSEDYLRLLRAVRFAARFDLTIDGATAEAMKKHAAQLKAISPERSAEELRLMLKSPTRGKAISLLIEFGLLDVIFRFSKPAIANGNESALKVVHQLGDEPVSLGLALAAIMLGRLGGDEMTLPIADLKSETRSLRQALRFSNEESDDFFESLEGVMIARDSASLTLAKMKRFLARPSADHSRRLMRALAKCGIQSGFFEEVEKHLAELAKTEFAPVPLLSGDDLITAGFSPGKLFKQLLEQVYDAQLEARISSKEESLELAKKLAGKA